MRKVNGTDRQQWEGLRSDLENRLRDAQSLNDHMRSELERVQNEKDQNERDMQAQMHSISSRASGDNEWKSRYESLDKTHQDLRADLFRQEKIAAEVKSEATGLLSQLKGLSQRTDQNVQREEDLVRKIHFLENEVQDWKNRYAKARTQARNAHAGPVFSPTSDPRQLGQDGSFSAPDGLVKDIYVTKFQIAVDELLHSARSNESDAVLPHVKTVVISVRSIIQAVGNSSSKGEQAEQLSKLKSKVSATTNNLITASKNFAFSRGFSPVSLLDAAASHLSASVIEVLRIVKIRPTHETELEQDDDENSIIADSPADYYGFSQARSSAGGDSIYSPPQVHQGLHSTHSGKKPLPNGIPNGALHSPLSSHSVVQGSEGGKIEELKVSLHPAAAKIQVRIAGSRVLMRILMQNFLDTRTSNLLTGIQTLVSSIRTSAPPPDILDTIVSITSTTSQIINQTHACVPTSSPARSISQRLASEVEKMEQQGREGEEIENEKDWNSYVKGLPPLAFEIAREVKELGAWVEGEMGGDFS